MKTKKGQQHCYSGLNRMKIYTIGFSKKSAEYFFEKLKDAGVKRVVDVRLNNLSQLSGFAKRDDLRYFLKELCEIEYLHIPEFAPTKEILDEYRKGRGSWSVYEEKFVDLMVSRNIEGIAEESLLDGDCLLCSEDKPKHCHRRLIAEYLEKKWKMIFLEHIMGR